MYCPHKPSKFKGRIFHEYTLFTQRLSKMNCMPILIINLCGEMVYILQQRLFSQSVSSEKSYRVLSDIFKTMFNEHFIIELFREQPIQTVRSVRQILEKLAHSSVMRLNDNSMDKLFDLMMMSFKFQLLRCISSQQILQLTLKHLEIMKALAGRSEVEPLVSDVIEKAIEAYSRLSSGDWLVTRQFLFSFFQGYKTKVSIFLSSGCQNTDGSFLLDTFVLPYGTEAPGTIRYYENNQIKSTARFNTSPCCPSTSLSTMYDVTTELGQSAFMKGPLSLYGCLGRGINTEQDWREVLGNSIERASSKMMPAGLTSHGSSSKHVKSDDKLQHQQKSHQTSSFSKLDMFDTDIDIGDDKVGIQIIMDNTSRYKSISAEFDCKEDYDFKNDDGKTLDLADMMDKLI